MNFDLWSEIDSLVAKGDTDPSSIADKILPRIPPSAQHDVLADLLRQAVTWRISKLRQRPMVVEESVEKGSRVITAKRWDSVAAASALRFVPGVGFKRVMDMTAKDCEGHAEMLQVKADGHIREAKRFIRLAELIRKHKVSTVGELPESVRVDAF